MLCASRRSFCRPLNMGKRSRDKGSPPAAEGSEGAHFGSFTFDQKGKRQRVKQESKLESKVDRADSAKAGDPFSGHARPSDAECRAARDSLALLHGEPERSEPVNTEQKSATNTILDSLVRTILSQNTTDTNSHRTFQNLKNAFKTWEAVRLAKPGDIEKAIKLGGLAATKTARIQDILNSVKDEFGECSLETMRGLSDEEVKNKLLQYNGVGPKTAACVLMFCLGRAEFPVDTHVWRITKSLGWVPTKATREQTYEHLNARIPGDVKHDLHVLLVEHGKRCPRCAKNNRPRKESHGPCPLTNLAAAVGKGEKPSARKAAGDAKHALELSDGDLPGSASEEDGAGEAADGVKEEVKEEVKDEVKSEVKEESGEIVVKEEPTDNRGEAEQVKKTTRAGRRKK